MNTETRACFPHDYHFHSRFSGDTDASMESMCRAAIEHGIGEVCFTEHFNVHPKEALRFQFPLDEWASEIERCRGLFSGKLSIKAGLEISEPHRSPDAVSKLVARYPFDMLIGSVHWVGDRCVFHDDFFDRPEKEAYGAYFEEVLAMTRYGGFDVVGHLDVVARKGFEVYGHYDPTHFETFIRPILSVCIEKGIALDVNGACASRPLGRLTPGKEILAWYAQMGGERVIASSDAHRTSEVGRGLSLVYGTLREAGFRKIVCFDKRNATYCEA